MTEQFLSFIIKTYRMNVFLKEGSIQCLKNIILTKQLLI
ncbi:hypothetical protein FM106_01385 [Brachybacterium faecium]|nr:hypothetical protein FM106_01385 [Brachybacterium faecium]